MKNLKYNVLLILAAGVLFSCEDLSPEDLNNFQRSEVTDPNLFAVGMYQGYQKTIANEYLITELRSDNARTDTGLGTLANIENYTLTPEFVEGARYWANNYSVVLNANLIIQNEDVHSLNLEGQRSLAEAYFMRALCHFNLVRTYENVPYINAVVAKAEDIQNFPQQNPVDMYSFIINDFNTSISYFEGSGLNNGKNKANLGAAYGFLAKAYLSIPGNPDYAAAYNVLSAHLRPDNQFGYRLLPVDLTTNSDGQYEQGVRDYLSIFQGNELNDEILFAVPFIGSTSGPAVSSQTDIEDQIEVDAQNWSFNMTEQGPSNGLNFTEDLLALLLSGPDDEVEVNEPIRGGVRANLEGEDIGDGLFDDDRTAGEDYVGTTGYENGQQKYYDIKYRDVENFSGVDAVVLRYADILLLFSEAILAGNDSNNPEAIEFYNLVRERVGASILEEGDFLFVDELLDERRRELTFENHRMWDLIRFGEAKAVEVLSNFANSVGFPFQDTDLYLPIPRREITATGGEGVTYNQNDGY